MRKRPMSSFLLGPVVRRSANDLTLSDLRMAGRNPSTRCSQSAIKYEEVNETMRLRNITETFLITTGTLMQSLRQVACC